jgi:hypothetical protein
MFRLHSFQNQTQSAPGKDISATGYGRAGGYLPNCFQNAFLLFGHETLGQWLSFKSAVGPDLKPPERATFKTANPPGPRIRTPRHL